MYIYIYIYMYICINSYIYVYICICAYLCVYICINMSRYTRPRTASAVYRRAHSPGTGVPHS